MFQIKCHHVDSFRDVHRTQFLDSVTRGLHILNHSHQRGLRDEELRSFAEVWIDDAIRHDILFEDDVSKYVELCFITPAMAATPRPEWVSKVLSHPSRAGNIKVEMLAAAAERTKSRGEP